MKAPDENPDLGQLNYPVYVAPIFDLPEVTLELFGMVILAYSVDTRHMWFDCFPKEEWDKKTCKLVYEERLQLLRHTLTEVADFTNNMDLPYKVDNPVELLDFYKEALTNRCKGVKIYDVDGKYEFDDNIVSDKYWELVPKEIVIK